MKKSSRVHITVLKIIFCHIYFSFLKVEIKWVNSRPLLYPNTGFPCGSDDKASTYNVGDQVQFLGREDLLENEMAAHSSTLAWKIPVDRGAW